MIEFGNVLYILNYAIKKKIKKEIYFLYLFSTMFGSYSRLNSIYQLIDFLKLGKHKILTLISIGLATSEAVAPPINWLMSKNEIP